MTERPFARSPHYGRGPARERFGRVGAGGGRPGLGAGHRCDARGVGTIKEDSERLWQGQGDLVFADHPVSATHRTGEEIADGVLCLKSIASVNAVDTGDGLVMLDTGEASSTSTSCTARSGRGALTLRCEPRCTPTITSTTSSARSGSRRKPTEKGLASAGRLRARGAARALRPLQHTLGWNTAINKRQFAIPVDAFQLARALPLPRRHVQATG